MLNKLYRSYLSFLFSRLLGGRKYSEWAKNTLELQKHVPIKNKKLARELEDACLKNEGVLRFSEYLTIDQFGKEGYHYTHKENGMTGTSLHWPKMLLKLCQKYQLHSLVEFGPGNGELGIRALKEAGKARFPLSWSGIEKNLNLQQETRKRFAKHRLIDYLAQLVTTLEELHLKEPCLFVFSYSLDNIPPDIFLNTKNVTHAPNAMIDVTVKHAALSEIVVDTLPSTEFDLSGWQLTPYQRLYLSTHAMQIFLQVLSMLPKGSRILIIDEFTLQRITPLTIHLGTPENLLKFQRYELDLQNFYHKAGENLLYFPLHLEAFLHVLDTLQLPYRYDTEKRFLKILAGETCPPDTVSLTHAILIDKEQEHVHIPTPIPFYPKDH